MDIYETLCAKSFLCKGLFTPHSSPVGETIIIPLTDEETEAQRLSNLLEVMQPISGVAGMCTRAILPPSPCFSQ